MKNTVCIAIVSMIFFNAEGMDSPYWQANKTRPLKGSQNNNSQKKDIEPNNTNRNVVSNNENRPKFSWNDIKSVPLGNDKIIEAFQQKVIIFFKLIFEKNKATWEEELGKLEVVDVYGCNQNSATLKLLISSQPEKDVQETIKKSFTDSYKLLKNTLESGTNVEVIETFTFRDKDFFYKFDWSFPLTRNNVCIQRIPHLSEAVNLFTVLL